MRLIRNIKNQKTYIKMSPITDSEYSDNIISVEHRSNNTKRDYLFVNKLQCKHIPGSPTNMINMCKKLAYKVQLNLFDDDKVLVIGMAETATAIGSIVAQNLKADTYVMHTTREEVPGSKNVVAFKEEHSHAQNQALLTYNSNNHINLKEFTYILFVEDEISTGKTILNFIKELNKKIENKDIHFGVASICNWLNSENKEKFKEYNIDEYFILSGELLDENVKMPKELETENIIEHIVSYGIDSKHVYDFHTKESQIFREERLGHPKKREIPHFKDIINLCKDAQSIRIIGSEEFMSIPIRIGAELERLGKDVICHSTTRSKIDVIKGSLHDGEGSGIKKRYKVRSAYADGRDTYIYNTSEDTDLVLIITDTNNDECFKNFYCSVASTISKKSRVIVVRL